MANPISEGAALGTSFTTVYTAGDNGGTWAQITQIQVANVDGSNDATVTVARNDTSAATDFHLAYQVNVAAGDSITVVSGGLVLENGDSIKALASAASDLEINVSGIEE